MYLTTIEHLTYTHPWALLVYVYGFFALLFSWFLHRAGKKLYLQKTSLRKQQYQLQHELSMTLMQLQQLANGLEKITHLPEELRRAVYIPAVEQVRKQTVTMVSGYVAPYSWWMRWLSKGIINGVFKQIKKKRF